MNSFTDLNLWTAFLQGIFSFASPCVLPLLPVYFGYLSGSTTDENGEMRLDRVKTAVNSVFFVVGCGTAFFLLGIGASTFGKFMAANRSAFSIAGGILIIIFGLLQLGLFSSVSFLQKERRIPINTAKFRVSPLSAILLGFAFSFAWTPCVGPALASILVMTGNAGTQSGGLIYILFYTLGFSIPFIVTGIFVSSMLDFLKKHRGIVKWTARAGGILLVCAGIFMLAGGTREKAASRRAEDVQESESTVRPEQKKRYVEAPDFSLTDQYGTRWNLSALNGKVVVLNFWATWCPPCRMEMPDFQKVYDELAENGNDDVFILGVASPDLYREKPRAEVVKFLESNGYSYPCLMDTSGASFRNYQVSAFPTTVLINRNGQIQNGVVGAITEEKLWSLVNEGLGM